MVQSDLLGLGLADIVAGLGAGGGIGGGIGGAGGLIGEGDGVGIAVPVHIHAQGVGHGPDGEVGGAVDGEGLHHIAVAVPGSDGLAVDHQLDVGVVHPDIAAAGGGQGGHGQSGHGGHEQGTGQHIFPSSLILHCRFLLVK